MTEHAFKAHLLSDLETDERRRYEVEMRARIPPQRDMHTSLSYGMIPRAVDATTGGNDVRGKWHTDVALDECAFFRDATATERGWRGR